MIGIVDDDVSVRESLRSLLESLGYAVSTFESAERFLESGRLAETSCLISCVPSSKMVSTREKKDFTLSTLICGTIT